MSEPVAYFITFRTYGTWLHGDERGSVDRGHNIYRQPKLNTHTGRQRSAQERMKQPSLVLDLVAREIVARTVIDVCDHHQWTLHASNVRSNHVHVVVSASQSAEYVMRTLKSWATRRLRERKLASKDHSPWSRHGSTKHVWNAIDLVDICRYVLEYQDEK